MVLRDPDPWADFAPVPPAAAATAPSGVPEVVVPVQPTPARPEVVQGTNLQNTRTGQEIQQGNYTIEATPRRNRYSDESQLRHEFEMLPQVRNYQEVVPQYISARGAADTRAGDLNLIYAFGKIMDPGSVVREGEMVMAQGAGAIPDRLRAIMGELDRRGRLSPETRADLMAELRTRRHQLATSYNQARGQYERIAGEYGFRGENVVGQHPAAPYAEQERREREDAQANMVGGVPWAHRLPHEQEVPPGGEQFQRDLQTALDAGQFTTPEDIVNFGRTRGFNIDPQQAESAIRGRARGERTSVHEPRFEVDISDMRGQGGAGETADSFMRQAANAPTAGAMDYISAGIDAATTDRGFSESLRREHAINDYDFEHHPVSSIAGSVAGSLLLPTGAMTEAKTAATIAMRSGMGREAALQAARGAAARRLATESGAYGGIHGALTSDGDLQDRVANAAVESVFGAATAYGGARFAPSAAFGGRRAVRSSRVPLVDPVTERLNQPLESAKPAQRVGAANAYGIDLPMGAAGARTAAILEKGLDIMPGSAGVMQDARTGLGDQVVSGLESVASRYGSASGTNEAGQQLQQGSRNWIDRFEATSARAYDRIPVRGESPANVSNTRTALDTLTSRFQSNPALAEALRSPQLERWRDALQQGGLSWEDLKGFRSRIGFEIGEQRFSDSPTRDDLRSLYAALSEDMRATAQARGPRALRAFERANNLYRQGQERIDNALVSILGDDNRNNPEAAARLIQTISRGGRGSSNLTQLGEIRNSLGKGTEWNEVASTLIRLMGQPVNSQGREFNPQTFVQNYADMSEAARNLLFGDRGRQELRRSLDGFVEVMQRLAGSNALRNTSNTAPGITAAGTVSTMGAAFLNPLLGMKLAATGAANYGMARLWTNPQFVRWATGYARAQAGTGSGRLTALARRREALARLARTTPALAAEYADVDQMLFGDDGLTPEMGTNGPPNPR